MRFWEDRDKWEKNKRRKVPTSHFLMGNVNRKVKYQIYIKFVEMDFINVPKKINMAENCISHYFVSVTFCSSYSEVGK